jgi:hypothetical protein
MSKTVCEVAEKVRGSIHILGHDAPSPRIQAGPFTKTFSHTSAIERDAGRTVVCYALLGMRPLSISSSVDATFTSSVDATFTWMKRSHYS